MNKDYDRCYELLGVKPGASLQELKTAYRDLTKVWHPDRFGHDERLQQKAQDKLKEINEAFDQLSSRMTPGGRWRSERKAQRASAKGFDRSPGTYSGPTTATKVRAGVSWYWLLPLVLFGVVFLFTTRSMLKVPQLGGEKSAVHIEKSEATTGRSSETAFVRNENRAEKPATAMPADQPAATQIAPVPTVTVVIDPASGMLAKSDCPTRTRMTYPGGSEPQGSCTIAHPGKPRDITADVIPQKESRVKSLAKRVAGW